MQTYKYSIKAKTGAVSAEQIDAVRERLEQRLNDSPDCLMSYAIFPTDGDILEHVDMDFDSGSLEAITLHTYSQLWDGQENDLFDCVSANLNEIHNEAPELPIIELPDYTGLDKVTFHGREGSIPDKLYHIVEAENLEDISREGLIPGNGSNHYKDTEKRIYLTDEKSLAAWVSVLPHTKEPVILEVDTKGIDVEYGRHFSDRSYLPNGYDEYRTTDYIPADHVKEANMGHGYNELATRLKGGVMDQLEQVMPDTTEFSEVGRGLDRLVYMNLLKPEEATALKASCIADVHNAQMEAEDYRQAAEMDDGKPPWDEDDDGKDRPKDGDKVTLKEGYEKLLFGQVGDFYKENGFAYYRDFGNGDTFVSNEPEKVNGVAMITMDESIVEKASGINLDRVTTRMERTTQNQEQADYQFVKAEDAQPKLWKYQFDMENLKPREIDVDTIYSPLNSDMAPYESGRFEDILLNSRIPGRSNIVGVKFEPNPDGSVDKMSLYTKNALTKDMERRTADYISNQIVSEFNDQSDDVKIKLDDMERIGKVDVSDKDFENDFGDMVASLSADEGMKL